MSGPSAQPVVANAAPGETILQAQGLTWRADERTLWENLDVTLRAGERLAVSGPSGSGKTLLLRTLAGLEAPQAGTILFRSRPLSAWSMPAYRARVVYLAQRPALPEGSVAAALESPFRLRVHRGRRFPGEVVRRQLAELGRGESFLAQRAENLSGGESQLVALLRALLIEPDILLLDEPTASLDTATTARIETLVGQWLATEPGRACIWTSHDRAQLARVSQRALSLGERP